MNNRALHISSINREKIDKNTPEDFIVKFSPPNQVKKKNVVQHLID